MEQSTDLLAPPQTTGARFERAARIMARLRAPGGCPWDREQTFDTIKRYTVEETYEALEAIDNRDWDELTGELGDLLLQVLFYAQMASEERLFTIDDVLDRLAEKLIRRHPHVFGDAKAADADQVLKNWEAIKATEKKVDTKQASETALGGISSASPALIEARKLSDKAAGLGFDWPDARSVVEKLREETAEIETELVGDHPPNKGRMEEEIGDALFTLVNLARHSGVDCESALKKANRKFRSRFSQMELDLNKEKKALGEMSSAEWEDAWQKSKAPERRHSS